MKAGKAIALILLAAGAGLGSWGVWRYLHPATPPDEGNTTPPPNNTQPGGGTPVKKPLPPKDVPIVPPTTTTVITSGFKVGENLYAVQGVGTNVYKTAAAGVSTLYKHFKPYYFIGTFLAKEGIYIKIAIQEAGAVYGTNNKVVYALTGEVFTTR